MKSLSDCMGLVHRLLAHILTIVSRILISRWKQLYMRAHSKETFMPSARAQLGEAALCVA